MYIKFFSCIRLFIVIYEKILDANVYLTNYIQNRELVEDCIKDYWTKTVDKLKQTVRFIVS